MRSLLFCLKIGITRCKIDDEVLVADGRAVPRAADSAADVRPDARSDRRCRRRSSGGSRTSACGTSIRSILFRITWKNEPVERGGLFNDGNWIEFPSALTGVDARIIGLVGKFFPTGAHKVGAAFGCLVPKLVSGQFDPTRQKAVWPSTGNFCRGGAFDSALLGCTAVAILPEEMSRERFAWLKEIGAEVIPTPGCESNVKEIYDKCWEIRRTRPDCVIFNQFEEFGNAAWHYHVTGKTIDEIFRRIGRQLAIGRLRLRDRQRRHDCGRRFPADRASADSRRRHRSAAMPDALSTRLRRPPHRRHRRQARAVDSQRAQHRHGRGDRR